jgi:hypothetical protein
MAKHSMPNNRLCSRLALRVYSRKSKVDLSCGRSGSHADLKPTYTVSGFIYAWSKKTFVESER